MSLTFYFYIQNTNCEENMFKKKKKETNYELFLCVVRQCSCFWRKHRNLICLINTCVLLLLHFFSGKFSCFEMQTNNEQINQGGTACQRLLGRGSAHIYICYSYNNANIDVSIFKLCKLHCNKPYAEIRSNYIKSKMNPTISAALH